MSRVAVPSTKRCAACGGGPIPRRQTFCSRKCASASWRKPEKVFQCIGCGITFSPQNNKTRPVRKFCSAKCYGHYEPPVIEKFWANVWKQEGWCWLWYGGVGVFGYGEIWNGARNMAAHRFAYQNLVGPIPEGLCVLHKCDVPQCVNPEHLFLGTKKDNTWDMILKGRSRLNQNMNLSDEEKVLRKKLATKRCHERKKQMKEKGVLKVRD